MAVVMAEAVLIFGVTHVEMWQHGLKTVCIFIVTVGDVARIDGQCLQ